MAPAGGFRASTGSSLTRRCSRRQRRHGRAILVARVARLDLASLASVQEFAEAWEGPLDLLVNNAGLMPPPRYEQTRDGFEPWAHHHEAPSVPRLCVVATTGTRYRQARSLVPPHSRP